jgi:hypothetical protein
MFSSVAYPPRVQPQAVVASRPAEFGNREIDTALGKLLTGSQGEQNALEALKALALRQTPIPDEHMAALAEAGLIFPQDHPQAYTLQPKVKTAIHELYAASTRK